MTGLRPRRLPGHCRSHRHFLRQQTSSGLPVQRHGTPPQALERAATSNTAANPAASPRIHACARMRQPRRRTNQTSKLKKLQQTRKRVTGTPGFHSAVSHNTLTTHPTLADEPALADWPYTYSTLASDASLPTMVASHIPNTHYWPMTYRYQQR